MPLNGVQRRAWESPPRPGCSGNILPLSMKVFLSHSTKDAAFVEKLAAELRAESIEPWLCEVDIGPGDNFVAKVEDGLRESDLALLVFSPDAARSAWTQVEWTSILAREVSESRIRLGVLLLAECEPPG